MVRWKIAAAYPSDTFFPHPVRHIDVKDAKVKHRYFTVFNMEEILNGRYYY